MSSPSFCPDSCFRKLVNMGISTEHIITRCNKHRHKLSYQGWGSRPEGRKGSQDQTNRSETPHSPTVRSPTRTPKLNNHSMYTEDIVLTHSDCLMASSVPVSPYDPCLCDSVNPLLPSAAGESLTDDSWARHQSLSTAISLGLVSLTCVCVTVRTLCKLLQLSRTGLLLTETPLESTK